MVLDGTDLFSFGVILFEALTGEIPWGGDTPPELAAARLSGPTPRPRARRPDVDARWDDVIFECLQVRLADRPKSATEVVERLGV